MPITQGLLDGLVITQGYSSAAVVVDSPGAVQVGSSALSDLEIGESP